MRRRWGFRGWAVVWAVLQFALPAAATFADASLERRGVGAESHAESRSDASCRPAHAAECAFCQLVLRTFAPTAGPPSVVAAIRVGARPPIGNRPWRVAADLTGRTLARAPPLG